MAHPSLALRVPKGMGEEARLRAYALGLLDTSRKPRLVDGHLEIPLRDKHSSLAALGEFVVQTRAEPFRRQPKPYDEIVKRVRIPSRLKDLLPKRWEKVGDILLFRLPRDLRRFQDEICRTYAAVLGARSVVEASAGIHGPLRTPKVELLWGDATETVHKENGILYKLDVAKVMFSSGNIDERVRMARVAQPGEVIVDMFAGIGYFSLPVAIHGGASRVYACEVHPEAFGYLVENIRLNEASAVVPLLGDCREVAPEGKADRVIMGYLRDTYRFLPKAIRTLRGEGWIHYHEACPDAVADRLVKRVEEAARSAGIVVKNLRRRRVKSYAPGVSHWVLDVLIT